MPADKNRALPQRPPPARLSLRISSGYLCRAWLPARYCARWRTKVQASCHPRGAISAMRDVLAPVVPVSGYALLNLDMQSQQAIAPRVAGRQGKSEVGSAIDRFFEDEDFFDE